MEVSWKVDLNQRTNSLLLSTIPDKVMFAIARQTLDMSIPIIPKSNEVNHSGTLRTSSGRGESGVHRDGEGYYIGSFTDYASYVYTMDDNTTNWTTPGTHSQWFGRTIRENGKVILENAVNETWKDYF